MEGEEPPAAIQLCFMLARGNNDRLRVPRRTLRLIAIKRHVRPGATFVGHRLKPGQQFVELDFLAIVHDAPQHGDGEGETVHITLPH